MAEGENAFDGAVSGAACSICGAGPAQVNHLISGPGVWICDGCVRASYEIIEGLEQRQPSGVGTDGDVVPAGVNRSLPVDDPIMATITRVQQAALQGHRSQAAAAFEQLWTQVKGGRTLHRISVAHYMADVQDDPADELEWDERALDAAAEVRPLDADSSAVAPLRPSLHVNTAGALNKLGRLEDARHQLAAAGLAAETLPEGGYARLVRSRIAARGLEMSGQRTLL